MLLSHRSLRWWDLVFNSQPIIRCSEYPMTLISIHDFVLRAWQHTRVSIGLSGTVNTAVRYLDLRARGLRTMMEAPVKREGCLRVVVISDTHNVGFKFVE